MTAQLTNEGTARTIQPASPAGRGRFRRIHLSTQDMNCAARRVGELQAPWSVDAQRHGR
jgi:hypothetical protein